MIGMTDREKELAVAGGTSGGSIVLAEVSAYWDTHPQGRPKINATLSIRITRGSEQDCIDQVNALAAWLGVEAGFRHGVHFAQRKWTQDGESLTIETHYTPDFDEAFRLQQEARKVAAA